MSVSRARRSLLSLPWIKDVCVRRVYPYKIAVDLNERVPVVKVQDAVEGAEPMLIGQGGVLLQPVTEQDFPFLSASGMEFGKDEFGRDLVLDDGVIAVLERLHEHGMSAGPFCEVDFSDLSSVLLYGEDDLQVILGPIDSALPRIDALTALIAEVDINRYRSIDLRFGREAILVPREVVKR